MLQSNKTLILGYGEVGQGLESALKKMYIVEIHDPLRSKVASGSFEVINICFPYSEVFDKQVETALEIFSPKLCIIHSTVSPRTKHLKGPRVVFSPIRGKHPNLAKGIMTFEKLVGGENIKSVALAQSFLEKVWIKTKKCTAKEAVFAKLLDTTYYGVCIAFAKTVNEICKDYDLDFEVVYTYFNETYNKGYESLGMKNVIRPVLVPPDKTGISGHCVYENVELLKTLGYSGFFDAVLAMGKNNETRNQKFKKEAAQERFYFFKKS